MIPAQALHRSAQQVVARAPRPTEVFWGNAPPIDAGPEIARSDDCVQQFAAIHSGARYYSGPSDRLASIFEKLCMC
jgi:hypothetical protein